MHLARVTGAVVSTQKSPSLIGKKLLLVRRVSADGELPASPTSGDEVAVDSVGAGIGELVLLSGGSSARHVFSGPNEAIDPRRCRHCRYAFTLRGEYGDLYPNR